MPITGRRQLKLLPESDLIGMSLIQYDQFLSENKIVPDSDANTKLVKKVGAKIQQVVEAYLKQNGQSKRVKGYDWEFNLVDDKLVNAWAMPGGKVVVYSGLLPVAKTEAGLAVVMGHEVAHAIARHGNERMSQQIGLQLGGIALGTAISTKSEITQGIFNQVYGISTGIGSLAFSRNNETEADIMGLVFMAMAGYNPNEAIPFWERMQATGGESPPEFLSTHPSGETRITTIKENLPMAMKYYKAK
jgi:predicted Zn-dependent protease